MRQHLVGVTAFGVLFWAGVRSRAKTSHFQEQMNATQDYPLTHLKTAQWEDMRKGCENSEDFQRSAHMREMKSNCIFRPC